jgi:general L-amino acid transport system substrate-binding protein
MVHNYQVGIFALLTAEELGVNSKNVDEMLNSANPDIKRLLGKEGDYGKGIGLDNDWAYNIVTTVGNYGDL